jgi:ankyrin repeat protein
MLMHYNAQVNAMTDARNDFRTVLHYAVLSGNVILVNLLLKQGARVDIRAPFPEPDRPSPLDLAILRGDPALVRILLENGANVNRCSPIIGSPLHVACADNIPHRMEIMKVRSFNFSMNLSNRNFVFRCFSRTAQTQTSKSLVIPAPIPRFAHPLPNCWPATKTYRLENSTYC